MSLVGLCTQGLKLLISMPCHQTCVDILMCPLVNISEEEIRKFEDNSSRNSGIY